MTDEALYNQSIKIEPRVLLACIPPHGFLQLQKSAYEDVVKIVHPMTLRSRKSREESSFVKELKTFFSSRTSLKYSPRIFDLERKFPKETAEEMRFRRVFYNMMVWEYDYVEALDVLVNVRISILFAILITCNLNSLDRLEFLS